jgi:hypothetical protein
MGRPGVGLTLTEFPRQKDVNSNFGDPAITLYSSPKFYIDIYFWFEGTTALHQHAFCGAFQVLHGSSIHSWYEFDRTQVVNRFVELGTMSLKICELLETGRYRKYWVVASISIRFFIWIRHPQLFVFEPIRAHLSFRNIRISSQTLRSIRFTMKKR